MDKIEKFFDEKASYFANHDPHSDEEKLSLLNKALVQKGDVVLDVGCGCGVITPLIFDLTSSDVYAIDLSNNMIQIAKNKNKLNDKLHFIHGNFLTYKFDNKFDKIIIYNAYPHFLDPTTLAKICYLNLNKGGILAILHSISRNELNSHHEAHANKVSRMLFSLNEEVKYFNGYFDVIRKEENSKSISIVLKKK